MSEGVWAIAEAAGDGLPGTSLEVISEGRRLCDLTGTRLTVVVLGGGAEVAEHAVRYGADRVWFTGEETTGGYSAERDTAAVAGLVAEEKPDILLFPGTESGREIAPRVAARLGTGLVPGCEKLEISPEGLLLQTMISHGGKVQVTCVCRQPRPQIAILEPGIVRIRQVAQPAPDHTAQVRGVCAGRYPAREAAQVVEVITADPRTMDISEAEIVVAGGKGAAAAFDSIRDLADRLGGAVAGSRMAVDLGCIGKERQIGQSGKTVSPALLVSCGISGANAHVAGIRDCKTVIAVNRDANAPMMKRADLAVVGDLDAVLPALLRLLEDSAPAPESEPLHVSTAGGCGEAPR